MRHCQTPSVWCEGVSALVLRAGLSFRCKCCSAGFLEMARGCQTRRLQRLNSTSVSILPAHEPELHVGGTVHFAAELHARHGISNYDESSVVMY